jgi:deoxycytidylate deaminase
VSILEIDPPLPELSRKERIFFKAAKTVSELSDHRFQLGCIVVDKHRIISSGHNSKTKCHRLQAELDQKYFGTESKGPVHAELDALLPLLNRRTELSNAILYIYREDKQQHLAMARPCPRCMSLIKKCGIKKIKYTTYDGIATEKIV